MGLDMYLYRKTYVKNWEWDKPEEMTVITATRGGKPLPLQYDNIAYIVEEVAYWRKANAIHNWFVINCQNGVDDCGEYYVTKDQIKKLVDICKKVIYNPALGPSLLPPTSGFFFGSTDYGEWYIEDLKNTVKQLTPLFDSEIGDFYYHSSW